MDVCVLIPCYNNLSGLVDTLWSITYHPKRLYVLIVDDGSIEPITVDALPAELQAKLMIKILNLATNKGITHALNTGLKWIEENLTVPYIARLDCADICHEERFYNQIDFLNANPEIGLLGSWCVFQRCDKSLSYTYKTPVSHQDIMHEMHYRNVFIHPTVVFRTKLIHEVGYYPDNYPHVEDYAYFWEIAKYTKTAILPQLLVTCELNEKGISISNRRKQLEGRYKVVSNFGKLFTSKLLGLMKLRLLMAVPYKLILEIKSIAGN